jgi:hypothetical protein
MGMTPHPIRILAVTAGRKMAVKKGKKLLLKSLLKVCERVSEAGGRPMMQSRVMSASLFSVVVFLSNLSLSSNIRIGCVDQVCDSSLIAST